MTTLLRHLLDTVTSPARAVTSPDRRREARLLSATLLTLGVLATLAELLARILAREQATSVSLPAPAYASMTIGMLGVGYLLSRTRFYRFAFGFVLAMSLVSVFVLSLYGVNPPTASFLVYALIPIVLTSIFASARSTVLIFGLILLGLLVVPLIRPHIPLLDLTAGPLGYVLVTGGVLAFTTAYHEHLEDLRRRELAAVERRYEALSEYANDGIMILDLEGNALDANRRMATMLGYTRDELIGMSLYDLMTEEDRDEAQRRTDSVLAGGSAPPLCERVLRKKNGQPIPVEFNTGVVRDEAGEPSHIQSVIRDVTARRQARQALQRRHRDLMVINRIISTTTSALDEVRILQTLCGELAYAFNLDHVYAARVYPDRDSAPVVAEYAQPGVWSVLGEEIPLSIPAMKHVVDQRTAIRILEPATDARMGSWAQLVAKSHATTLLLVPLLVRNRVVSTLVMALADPDVLKLSDLELIRNAAATVAQAIETATLYQQQQQRAEDLSMLIEQRTGELQRALIQARAADQAKSQFVSNVSHELRTPLTSIRLYLDLAQRGKPERIQAYLSALMRETQRLQHLVEGLLLVSRLDLGQIQISLEPVALNPIVETLAADRQALFADRDLKLNYETDPRLPEITGDPRLLEQVLTNLLTNAMNYTPPGGSVRLATERVDVDGTTWVKLEIEDTGFGISHIEQRRLFRRFERGQASAALQVPGTGLGLAISREIVELHRGKITVESEIGEGSTFTVWLPVGVDLTVPLRDR